MGILQRLLIACATNIRLLPVLKSGNLNGLLTVSLTNIGLFSVVNSARGDFEKNFVISCDQCNILFNRFYSCHKTHIDLKKYGNKSYPF